MVFAHGFGCDQNMWRFVAPAFEATYKVIRFDYVGHGRSDTSSYNRKKYERLDGFVDDLIAIFEELNLNDVVFVGHSVSAMIGVLAAIRQPHRFKRLVLVCPSPRYIDDDGYTGGFSRESICELLDFLDTNHLGWSSAMAPVIMANSERPELGEELANSFCRTDPEIAKQFARATFLSDNRVDLEQVRVPSLILQSEQDTIAPRCVGEYVHAKMQDSVLVVLNTTGHCPHLSDPSVTIEAIHSFLGSPASEAVSDG